VVVTDVSVDPADLETADLAQWLHETYYDDDKPPYFTKIDIQAVGKVLMRLLRIRPSERSSANDVILKPLHGNSSSAERQQNGP
jgi:hypothetical protein